MEDSHYWPASVNLMEPNTFSRQNSKATVIASEAKQSIVRSRKNSMDCFVAALLAMTAEAPTVGAKQEASSVKNLTIQFG